MGPKSLNIVKTVEGMQEKTSHRMKITASLTRQLVVKQQRACCGSRRFNTCS